MSQFNGDAKVVGRRGFLKGSAFFAAAAVGLSVAPSFAQEQQAKPAAPAEEKPAEPAGEQPKKDESPAPKKDEQAKKEDPNKLVDKNGREYRLCERCGGNMYKEGNTWTCEQCGLSYVE